MPVVEIVSFTVDKAFSSDLAVNIFDKSISIIKQVDECLSVHHGFQLDGNTRAYLIITWASYDHAFTTKRKGNSSFDLDKLGLSLNEFSIQLFSSNEDPISILDSPLPELRCTRPTPGHKEAELGSFIGAFEARVRNGDCIELAFEDFPSWTWGVDQHNQGSSIYLLGFKGVELRKAVLETRPFAEVMQDIYEVSHVDIKPLSLTRA